MLLLVFSHLSPVPTAYTADSPVRRLPGYKACSPVFRLDVARRLALSLSEEKSSERKDAASQTDDVPQLTLKDLKQELRAFAIAFGF